MNYSLLISFLAFGAAVQLLAKYGTKPLTNAAIAALIPVVVDTFIKWIYHYPILTVRGLLVCSLQFVIALLVFYKLQYEESYTSWFIWVIGGGALIIFVVPMLVNNIF